MSLVFWLLCLGFGLSLDETLLFGHCILVIYIEEVLLGFFPLGFSQDKLLRTLCLCFFQ